MFDLIDELLIVVLLLLLVYFCWKSTEVREYPFSHPPGASSTISVSGLHRTSLGRDVALVPVRGNLLNRLVDQITTGSSLRHRRRRSGLQARLNNSVEEIEFNEGNILMTHVLSSWASNDSISTGTNTESEEGRLQRQTEYLIEEIENEAGPAAIIREMDRDLPEASTSPLVGERGTTTTATEEVQNYTNENNENGNKQAMGDAGTNATADAVDSATIATTEATAEEATWKIKIKYLNDDMKVVEARPSQTLGEFKKQNFATELAANKLVRLVFNGKVLQPDGASLRSCALFENCVVHCLVHNMPPNSSRIGGQQQQQSQSSLSGGGGAIGQQTMQAGNRQSSDVIARQPFSRAEVLVARPSTVDDYHRNRQLQAPEERDGSAAAGGELREGNYSAAHLMRNRLQQWLLQQWNRLYNWRFFTELLLLAFTVTTIYLRVRYAELFTATATIGLILVSVMVLGISVTLNIL